MKKIIIVLVVALLFAFASQKAYVVTEWEGNNGTFETPISIKTPVYLKDAPVKIYCTFDDKGQALKEIRRRCSNVLNIIAEEYHIKSAINDRNWQEYEVGLVEHFGRPVTQDEFYEEADLLDSFFDIYENYDENKQQIKDYINEKIFG